MTVDNFCITMAVKTDQKMIMPTIARKAAPLLDAYKNTEKLCTTGNTHNGRYVKYA